MKKFSDRVLNMHYSPIRKLVPYIDEAKKEGVKVYQFHIGQPDVETPDTFFEGLDNYKEKIVTLTQKEAIETAIKYLKFGLMKNKKNYEKMKDIDVEFDSLFEIEDIQMEKLQQAFKIYSIILPTMWW
mgnify:CR=1 FL=1